jgi:biopolymer transport protein ExbD
MRLRTKNRLSTEFSMASMTDMVFLLLIFFMLGASFVAPTSLPIDLPASHTAHTTTPQVYISITSKLDYYIGNQQVDLGDLKGLLQEKLPPQDGTVLLHIDQSVPVKYVVQVIDIANSLHAEVSIATRPDQ